VRERDGAPVPTGALFQVARSALASVDRLSYAGVVLVMGLMATIVAVQVFVRYALGSSIDSADELARLFFVWAMFLAIPHGVRHGVHVGIEALVALLPAGKRLLLYRLNSALAAALMALVFVAVLPVMVGKWSERMPTLEITAAVYYIAVLIAAGHGCLHLLLQAWGGPSTWETSDPTPEGAASGGRPA